MSLPGMMRMPSADSPASMTVERAGECCFSWDCADGDCADGDCADGDCADGDCADGDCADGD